MRHCRCSWNRENRLLSSRRGFGSRCPNGYKTGAEAVDFGEAEAESSLSDSESEFGLFSPAASLFNMFLISIHSLRPWQAGSPAPDT